MGVLGKEAMDYGHAQKSGFLTPFGMTSSSNK